MVVLTIGLNTLDTKIVDFALSVGGGKLKQVIYIYIKPLNHRKVLGHSHLMLEVFLEVTRIISKNILVDWPGALVHPCCSNWMALSFWDVPETFPRSQPEIVISPPRKGNSSQTFQSLKGDIKKDIINKTCYRGSWMAGWKEHTGHLELSEGLWMQEDDTSCHEICTGRLIGT